MGSPAWLPWWPIGAESSTSTSPAPEAPPEIAAYFDGFMVDRARRELGKAVPEFETAASTGVTPYADESQTLAAELSEVSEPEDMRARCNAVASHWK